MDLSIDEVFSVLGLYSSPDTTAVAWHNPALPYLYMSGLRGNVCFS